ncbi:hypothetical protein BJ122_102283 [Rhodopseudomonas faecalis]|uniref:Uncharacterized protein n=1 Tax=Rhodopseudomonas faecalis TaxID=99655 RepID=A0A318TMG4_9BRAD|nr:hypothetical protein [Rhodopseudomonas faecalis]PYF05057.1 hypothetical protein BJ122_102283 [Rhodopseudomonas faecalis]
MIDGDPNEAYEIDPERDAALQPPLWVVRCNGIKVRWFAAHNQAERYIADPELRAKIRREEKPLHLGGRGL